MHYDIFPNGLLSGAVCPRASCQDRCGKSSTDDHSLCSCDHHCQLLSDCCVDFSTECLNLTELYPSKPYHSYSVNLAVIENVDANGFESQTHLHVAFRDVDYCPKPSPLHEKCKNTYNKEDFRRLIPVCHPKSHVVFQNQYCANCNGYHINELVSFEYHLDIPSACKELNLHPTGSIKPRLSLEHMITECKLTRSLFVPKHCFGSVYRNKRYKRTDQEMCKSHLNPVVVSNNSNVYCNKYCVPDGITDIECFNGEWPFYMPTNVLREANDIISLDSSGVPVLNSQIPAASQTPRKCVSFNLFAIFARIYFESYWLTCDLKLHICTFLLGTVSIYSLNGGLFAHERS